MRISNLSVSYGAVAVYSGFNLDIEEKSITCILGESGCGKTTLLNAIAGLVLFSGEITPAKISYVFQTPRLVPNLTVIDNLKLIGAEEGAAKDMLNGVGLQEKIYAYPKTLSGGEEQRVALCRAFLYPADMLLMDEPFSSLDLKSKLSVMRLFVGLCKKSGRGALFVTHDIDEALYLADRIIVLGGGKILADMQNVGKEEYGCGSLIRSRIIKLLSE